jgi:hypothetical protein
MQPTEVLANRVYRFDMERFWPTFEKMTHVEEKIQARHQAIQLSLGGSFNSVAVVQDAFEELLKSREGVTFQLPAAVFLNDRRDEALVRGTPHQCAAVKHLLTKLKGQPVEVSDSLYEPNKPMHPTPR